MSTSLYLCPSQQFFGHVKTSRVEPVLSWGWWVTGNWNFMSIKFSVSVYRKNISLLGRIWFCLFVLFDLIWFITSHQQSFSFVGTGLLSWTSTKLWLMCLAQGHNAVTPVRLEPAVPRSRVKHSKEEYGIYFQKKYTVLGRYEPNID